jgi:peptidyl-prolyl cis-trans isomerase C
MEWKASHILVKNPSLARDLTMRIKRGEDFSKLAREFSTCPSKAKGGDLGWFTAGQMVKPFEEAVKKMAIGAISDPVSTQFGFHVIKVTGRK